MSDNPLSALKKTTCAVCGEHKECPLRRDEMDGYVCLTCIDKRLDILTAKVLSTTLEATEATIRSEELEELVAEISGYLDPTITGQINTINTGSLLHLKMWKALSKES